MYAKWTLNGSHTIIFSGNGATGGETASQSIVEGLPTALRVNGFTKAGYTFGGWSISSNGAVVYADEASFTMGSSNLKLYAIWTINASYTITFNGNINTGGATTSQSLVEGLPTALRVNGFTKAGYTFGGWSTSSNGVVIYADKASFTIGSSNVTLYAKWIINTSYTITYNGNSNTGGATASQSIVEGLPTVLRANGFTKTGYTFAGWSTSSNGVVIYADKANFTIGSSNVTLYAKWIINASHIITFNGNTNTGGVTASQSLVDGLSAALRANGFTKAGYTFAGWSTSSNGAVVYANEVSFTMSSSNVTLYAIWTINSSYSITFDGNGHTGGATSSQNLVEGMPTALRANGFSRAGYTFLGWLTSSEGGATQYSDGSNFTIGAENVTLYAKWHRNGYSVLFNGNNNTQLQCECIDIWENKTYKAT